MKIVDRIIIFLFAIIIFIISTVLILIPFDINNVISNLDLNYYSDIAIGNFWVTLFGLVFFVLSIRLLTSGFSKDYKSITTNNKHGEIKISSKTIEGLTRSSIKSITGITDNVIKVKIDKIGINIVIKLHINPNVNIPETAEKMQNSIKNDIETYTGITVNSVKVDVSNISTPGRALN